MPGYAGYKCITCAGGYRIRYLKHPAAPRESHFARVLFFVCNRFCYLTILSSCTSFTFIFHNQPRWFLQIVPNGCIMSNLQAFSDNAIHIRKKKNSYIKLLLPTIKLKVSRRDNGYLVEIPSSRMLVSHNQWYVVSSSRDVDNEYYQIPSDKTLY